MRGRQTVGCGRVHLGGGVDGGADRSGPLLDCRGAKGPQQSGGYQGPPHHDDGIKIHH